MFFKKLNNHGIAHTAIPVLVVLIVAVAGTFLLVSSKAATAEPKQSVKISIKAYYPVNCEMRWPTNPKEYCELRKSKAVLFVESHTEGARCNNRRIHNGTIDLGKARKLNCTPGTYNIRLKHSRSIGWDCGDLCRIPQSSDITTKAKERYNLRLGSSDAK